MKSRFATPLFTSLLLAAGMIGSPAVQAQNAERTLERGTLREPVSVTPSEVKWGPGPASLPKGAELVVLEGDLTKAEPYTFRLKFPDGYRVAPHTHPVNEHITVLQGTLMMGMGRQFDKAATRPLPAGSLFILPQGDAHYVWTRGGTIVQLHGIGPWGITYVNPADDPRNRAANGRAPAVGSTGQQAEKTLYERLGGVYAIATVVDDFIERLLVNDVLNANPKIREARDTVPKAGIKYRVTSMVSEATGGPQKYTGRTMKESHKHLNITEREWQAMLTDFKKTLDKFKVPEREQKELFAIVATTKSDIVTASARIQ